MVIKIDYFVFVFVFFYIVDQQDVNDTNLAEVYEKLILNNSIVMSKSEICIKLKHVTKISTLRDKISAPTVELPTVEPRQMSPRQLSLPTLESADS
jgi:hypothetical protein